ncbi:MULTISPECIES: hypothetical protein [Aequorivita]|uniref:DUF3822 family protein n=1 Tax=Aequorivita iocasae TaxID=2803865 RepID=A0ABX7DUT7_9FLAO|nr:MULTISPECIES: hypothetical protein [Aequorivita]QQX76519.1 hypothetical protein JK629_14520 [Aequorivita iocasae]UCA55991.1 hypothetical protein LDL78_14590 [Aequorivita sp. F7]
MNFFSFFNETDVDKVGNLEGSQSYLVNDSYETLPHKNLYKPVNISKIEAVIEENAIITDVISLGNLSLKGIMVNKKFKAIVEKYKLKDIQFVPVNFLNKTDVQEYFFMFFNSDLTHFIDYDKTKFVIQKKSLFKDNAIQTSVEINKNNRNDLIELDREYAGSIKYSILTKNGEYYFNTAFDYDVFRIGHFNLRFYFSEGLKEVLINSGLTGFYFSDLPVVIYSNKGE